MALTRKPLFGWPDGLELSSAHLELQVTTAVGPRILSLRRPGGENVLRIYPEQTGTQGEPDYQVRGGHRLWISPENDLTYAPDNQEVQVEVEGETARLINPPTGASPVRKVLQITLAPNQPRVELHHTITNESGAPLHVAVWPITVMRPGGTVLIPQPPLGSHETDLLPRRVIVPWTYTDLSDPRWKLGTRLWRLTPQTGAPPTKLGLSLTSGWAGYALADAFFIKEVPYEAGATYPDFGCNFETFSKDDFVELETLSPQQTLAPGESLSHREVWHLLAESPDAALDDAALAAWLQPRLATCGLL